MPPDINQQQVTDEDKELFISTYGGFAKVLETNDRSQYYKYLQRAYPSHLEELKKDELGRDKRFEDWVKIADLFKNIYGDDREELKKTKKQKDWENSVDLLKNDNGYDYVSSDLLRSSNVIWKKSKDTISVEIKHEEDNISVVRIMNIKKVDDNWYFDSLAFPDK